MGEPRGGPATGLDPGAFAVFNIGLRVSAAFAGSDLLQNLTPLLVHPFWFATPENGWQSLFQQYIPTWFAPRDLEVVRQ